QITANTTTFYFLTAYSAYGCKSNVDTVEVDVYECPTLRNYSVPDAVCAGDSALLRVDMAGYKPASNIYMWQISADGGNTWTEVSGSRYTMVQDRTGSTLKIKPAGFDLDASNNVRFRAAVMADTLRDELCNTVYTPALSLNVDTAHLNPPTLDILGEGDFCTTACHIYPTYEARVTPGYGVAWKQNGGGVLEWDGNDHKRSYTVHNGDKVIGVLYGNSVCVNRMNISDTITVRFHRPVKVKAWADTMIRKNDVAMLHALATEGTGSISYSWTDASLVADATLADTWTKPLASTRIFTVKATDSFSCEGKATVLVKVNDTCIVDVKLQGSESVCINETATFQGLVTGGRLFGPYQTAWTVNPPLLSNDGSIIVPNPNTASMSIADAQPGVYTVKFIVTDTLAQTKKYCNPDGIVMS
ncbi:MAG: hypothetical protein K2O37_06170, partial [Bacteroidales bacterium]|nr:hypothetical protein [Bacteroidales bacterium]